MKRIYFLLLVLIAGNSLFAQAIVSDSALVSSVTINKDPRLDLLAKVQVDYAKLSGRFTKGYRLFVLKTNDRDYAMKVRSYLLQNFPEEKVIMSYQAPFIKMKFGDFLDKEDAEKCKNRIIKGGVVTGGIYVVPDTIELKPDKEEKQDDIK
jgi:hypothetical protein